MAIALPPPAVQALNHLRYSDPVDLEAHPDLLSGRQLRLLGFLRRFRQGHLANGSILIASGSRDADRYCLCGSHNGRRAPCRCRLRLFCDPCARFHRLRYLNRYVPGFPRGQWRFATLSYERALPFTSTQARRVFPLWNAATGAIRRLVGRRLVSGAFFVEEIKIIDFLPLRVLPHAHAILCSEVGNGRLEDELHDLIRNGGLREACRDHRLAIAFRDEGLNIPPSIQVRPIRSPRGLGQAINYMVKPIDLSTRYDLRWEFMETNAMALNNELTEFVTGVSSLTENRRMIATLGNLDTRSPAFIGIPTPRLVDHREEVQAIMQGPVDPRAEEQEEAVPQA